MAIIFELNSYYSYKVYRTGGGEMGVEPVSLRRLIERVVLGELRIPAFQRGFVWNPDKVQFLMDSIYKGYPIGTLLVWRAREQLTSDRALGPYLLSAPRTDYPIDYVLDGQQRLTSLFGVFQTEIAPSPNVDYIEWLDVYFDILADVNAQDSQFLALKPEQQFPLAQ